MRKRKLMIFLFVFIIILLVVLLCLIKIPKKPENTIITDNSSEVINQGDRVLKYNHMLYLADTVNNIILEYDDTNRQLNDITKNKFKKIEDKLYIVKNRLLFTADDVSYNYNFQTKEVKRIFDGKLEFADDDVYFYTKAVNGVEYLYVSNYDEKNMEATSNFKYDLAHGKDIYFLRKQGEIYLFGSVNSSSLSTLFYVDIEKQKCEVLIDKCIAENIEQKVYITDAYVTDEFYYYILANIYESSVGSVEESFDYYERDVNSSDGYIIFKDVGRRFNMLKGNLNTLLVRTKDYFDGTNMWISVADTIEDDINNVNQIQGNVKELFEIDDNKVIYDGKIIGELNSNNAWISYVTYIENNFYLSIASKGTANWYVYDGVNNLKRIY